VGAGVAGDAPAWDGQGGRGARAAGAGGAGGAAEGGRVRGRGERGDELGVDGVCAWGTTKRGLRPVVILYRIIP